ncbi:retrovirus-related Pol polyprotein from transposon 17.6 [Trichonephila clavata]|uniref:Retrovirus-related Pol polyprotein from transposon 17.6 n=1 Tax=Trichonephila clavata TaxID=2740835 RepID=A0A8X6H3K2_TRICU|nr:retrovirus-related Pol polyprotein from transposon 17.6 [Trichonephila clavata]
MSQVCIKLNSVRVLPNVNTVANRIIVYYILETNNPQNQSSVLSPEATAFIPKVQEIPNSIKNSFEPTTSTVCASRSYNDYNSKQAHILLCTALIRVRNSKQELVKCRCLLDTGSQRSFISNECAKKLGLTIRDSSATISCLGSFNTVSNGEVDLLFTSHFESDLQISTSAFVIEKVTDKIPHVSLPANICYKFNDFRLADPSFHKSANIDILLGVNVFLNLIIGEIIKRAPNLPFAMSTN